MNMRKNSKILPSSGASLTETLIVFLIIAVFIIMTTLLMDNVKDAAETAACMSNLKKLYIGMMMYADDHDGYWIGSGEDGIITHTNMIWTGEKKCWLGILYPEYVNDLNVFYCPSQKIKNRQPSVNRGNFEKKDEKCRSDYEGVFYSGYTILLGKLNNRMIIRCGGQELMPSPHGDREIVLSGGGSIRVAGK